MKTLKGVTTRILIGVAVVLALGAYVGCSSEEADEPQATADAVRKTKTPAAGTVQKARDLAQVLSNPKEGLDPVCGMAVDGSTVVTVKDRNYGVCSQNCADLLQENPDKYLVAAGDHDGHDHDH